MSRRNGLRQTRSSQQHKLQLSLSGWRCAIWLFRFEVLSGGARVSLKETSTLAL